MAKDMTPEKAKVYVVIGDVIAKLTLALMSGVAFLVVTIKLVVDPSWPVASAQVVFTGALTYVFKHYFPSKETKSRASQKPKSD